MKTLYLLAFTLFTGLSFLNAQSIIVRNTADGATIGNGSVFYQGTTANAVSELDFEFKNTSTSTKNYNVRRFDLVVNKVSSNDSAEAYYCTGLNCYPTTTTITPTPVTVNANSTVALKIYLSEASVAGQSSIKYEIYDASNINDISSFTVKYNNILSVKTLEGPQISVSDVYPNPVSSKGYINLNATNSADNSILNITNTLGSVVLSKTIDISQGKNTISLETENLTSGVYFITIVVKHQRIVKKFYVN